MSAQEAHILRKAADLLIEKGWTPFPTHRSSGPFCAIEAIQAVTLVNSVRSRALEHVRSYLGRDGVAAWNDAQPGPEPVVTALRAAADEAEQA